MASRSERPQRRRDFLFGYLGTLPFSAGLMFFLVDRSLFPLFFWLVFFSFYFFFLLLGFVVHWLLLSFRRRYWFGLGFLIGTAINPLLFALTVSYYFFMTL